MFAESETELRDLIVQNLEACGFLNKIKAELRAGVFLALAEEGNLRKSVPLFNEKFDEYVATDEGKVVLSIIREFLEYFNLNFTLSIFDPECGNTTSCTNREDLCKQLDLNESEFDGPIISALLKLKRESKLQTSGDDGNRQLETISENVALRNKNNSHLPKEKSSDFLSKNFISDLKFEKNKESKDDQGQSEITKDNQSLGITSLFLNKSSNDKKEYIKPQEDKAYKDHESFLDPFFDEPVPSEKTNFLPMSSTIELDEKKKSSVDISQFSKSSLSSLKDLPSLTKRDDLLDKDSPSKALHFDNFTSDSNILDPAKNNDFIKKDFGPESIEESSSKQLNSDGSISEEIEDLLTSDDATSDQTVSQISDVTAVDHLESCHSLN